MEPFRLPEGRPTTRIQKVNEMYNSETPQVVNADPQVATPQLEGIDIDLNAWRATACKLSLRQTGELMRSLVRATTAKRPNREQRLLLAIYACTSDDEEEVTQ
jgi:hypothetical protein